RRASRRCAPLRASVPQSPAERYRLSGPALHKLGRHAGPVRLEGPAAPRLPRETPPSRAIQKCPKPDSNLVAMALAAVRAMLLVLGRCSPWLRSRDLARWALGLRRVVCSGVDEHSEDLTDGRLSTNWQRQIALD